ncbi:hypothetical protein [Sphingobium sp. CFD-2]|uniref:hypothetical protein n=1 Tax=Sphingobium sp. CFD-2 TaxID=2878542 RepID=UPI00214B2172|nr:hypothetical protein [Sphingobium sp. CFD-2]
MDDFYAARSSTSPPPPWSNFAPPFSDIMHGIVDLRGSIQIADQTGRSIAIIAFEAAVSRVED